MASCATDAWVNTPSYFVGLQTIRSRIDNDVSNNRKKDFIELEIRIFEKILLDFKLRAAGLSDIKINNYGSFGEVLGS